MNLIQDWDCEEEDVLEKTIRSLKRKMVEKYQIGGFHVERPENRGCNFRFKSVLDSGAYGSVGVKQAK